MNKFIIIFFLGLATCAASLLTACAASTPVQPTFQPVRPVIVQTRPSTHHPDAIAGVFAIRGVLGATLYRSDEFLVPGRRDTRWRLFSDRALGINLLLVAETVGSWQYEGCRDVAVLADGIRVPVSVGMWAAMRDPRGDSVPSTEYVSIVLAAESAVSISRANSVQIAYCESVMEFPREGRQAIGEMIRRLGSI